MNYYIDLHSICLQEYKSQLGESDLLPSRRILKENLDDYFDILAKAGFQNVGDLQNTLKSKIKLQRISKEYGIPENYLKILLREINSMLPKPNTIADFRDISEITLEKLEKLKIKTTVQLFDKIDTPEKRAHFAINHSIAEQELLFLTKLTDVSRIRWVGSTFAYVLVKSGYDTVEKIAAADYYHLYETITRLNKNEGLYKGNIGLNDMKLTVNTAKNLPVVIKY